jgi:group I intron endonuclease
MLSDFGSYSLHNQGLTGVYAIVNTINGKVYIGSTSLSFSRRWSVHLKDLQRQKHHSLALQRAFNKYGEESFSFKILAVLDGENHIEREQYYMDAFKSYKRENGYNMLPVAGSQKGFLASSETRMKLSKLHTGSKRSAETKKRMSLKKLGQNHPKFGGHYHTPFGIFESSYEAARSTGLHSNTIYRRCHNPKKASAGWSFAPLVL